MTPLKAALQRIVADTRVTDAELDRELKPLIEQLPKRASESAREVLALYFTDQLDFEPMALNRLKTFLRERGYDADRHGSTGWPPVQHGPPLTTAERHAAAIRGNVTEEDLTFTRLSSLVGRSTETTTIAVLDSGFDLAHPAFEGRIAENPKEVLGSVIDHDGNGLAGDRLGYDFGQGDAEVHDPAEDHGTHVMALASEGTTRLKAIPIKISDGNHFDAREMAAAVDYAVAQGATIVNFSIATTEPEEVLELEAAFRRHPHVLFVAGAGNWKGELGVGERYGAERFLAARQLDNMVVVTATSSAVKAPDPYFPTSAKFVELVAPARRLSAVPGEKYRPMSGTSMSTPQVTAIAGKCLTLAPTLSPRALRVLLRATSDESQDWMGLIAAQGPVNADRAQHAAAALSLIRRDGQSVDAALDRLGATGIERQHLQRAIAAVLEEHPAARSAR